MEIRRVDELIELCLVFRQKPQAPALYQFSNPGTSLLLPFINITDLSFGFQKRHSPSLGQAFVLRGQKNCLGRNHSCYCTLQDKKCGMKWERKSQSSVAGRTLTAFSQAWQNSDEEAIGTWELERLKRSNFGLGLNSSGPFLCACTQSEEEIGLLREVLSKVAWSKGVSNLRGRTHARLVILGKVFVFKNCFLLIVQCWTRGTRRLARNGWV